MCILPLTLRAHVTKWVANLSGPSVLYQYNRSNKKEGGYEN